MLGACGANLNAKICKLPALACTCSSRQLLNKRSRFQRCLLPVQLVSGNQGIYITEGHTSHESSGNLQSE